MKKAGIVLDSYKEEVFKKLIGEAGFEFEIVDGPMAKQKTMTVKFHETDFEALQRVIAHANRRAKR